MNEHNPTIRQIVLFTVLMSFIVSVIGTVLTVGILGPLSGAAGEGGPFVFNRPTEKTTITQKEISEQILRQDEQVVRVVEETSPAVVSVVASKDVPVVERYFVDPFGGDPFFQQFFGDNGPGIQVPQYRQKGTQKQEVSAGTGFIVSSDGLIITNKHVVQDKDAEYIVLMNDGRKKPAKVLARDPLQDLAVLKVEGEKYPSLTLGDSATIKIGQSAIAIGNALGEFRNTVSVGVISGLHRSVIAQGGGGGPEELQELIQTDAALNPGNSGGPLLNLQGEVVGMNTAVAQGAENIGFAIPINKAKRAIENVKQSGRIIYPFLGVRYVAVDAGLAEKEKLGRDFGVFLIGGKNEPAIVSESPAAKAGLKERDIILELNGEKIDADHTLASLIQKYQVGQEITLKVFRDGKEFEVRVKLEERK